MFSFGLIAWYLRPQESDRRLKTYSAIGWAAQLGAVLYNYIFVPGEDYLRYHTLAAAFAQNPTVRTDLNLEWGTEGIALVLSVLYQLAGTSIFLGYVVFAALAMIGKIFASKLLFDNRDILGNAAPIGALVLMLLPSMNIWAAAASKEALAIFGIGVFCLGLARPGAALRPLFLAAGLAIVAIVRPHVSLLLAWGLVASIATTRMRSRRSRGKITSVVIGAGLLMASLALTAAFLETGISLAALEERRLEVASTTQSGGTTFAASPVRSIGDIPVAVANVLVRPYPWEVTSVITAAQSVENVLLLAGFLFVLIRRRKITSVPPRSDYSQRLRLLRIFGLSFVVGFLYVFSTTYNLGLISRQKAQLWIPFVLLLTTLTARTRNRRATTKGASRNSPDCAKGLQPQEICQG